MVKKVMRVFSAVVLSVLLLAGLNCSVQAQEGVNEFPSKPIKLIVHYSAGGSTDLTARMLAKKAGEILGQPIVVVNKKGGGGAIGIAAMAAAKPDGYTIGTISGSGMSIIPHMRELPYDSLSDFDLILQFSEYLLGLCVRDDAPWNTLEDVVEYARKNPEAFTFGTSGTSGIQYLTMERIAHIEKVKFTHTPYPGGAGAVTACLGGHIDGAAASEFPPYVKAGQLKALVIFGSERVKDFPEVPCIQELYGFEVSNFVGIAGPTGIPEPILNKLQEAFRKAMDDPDFTKVLEKFSMPKVYRGREDFEEYLQKQYKEYGEIISYLGMGMEQ